MTAAIRLNKQTQLRINACAVFGLSFWSDHPNPSHVWAADYSQRFHVVKINRKDGTAEHACRASSSDPAWQCAGADEPVSYAEAL